MCYWLYRDRSWQCSIGCSRIDHSNVGLAVMNRLWQCIIGCNEIGNINEDGLNEIYYSNVLTIVTCWL